MGIIAAKALNLVQRVNGDISMRSQVVAAAVPFVLLLSAQAQEAPRVSEEARRLHQEAFVFDGHLHMINRQLHLGGNIGDRVSDGQVDLPRMKDGGVDAFFMTLFVMEQYYPARYETRQTLRLMNMALDQVEQNSDVVELARNASDIERINRAGKMAAVLDLEGGFDLDGDLDVLRSLYRLGLRVVQLPAHNWANEFADSCCAPARWNGLTDHGRDVVREMNRLGMLINVSHASDQTLAQALEVSTHPIVATHHGLRSLNDIPRNMPDDLLKKLAAKGGVIGFHIGNAFHNRAQFDWLTKQAGKPFWDTSEIGGEKERLSIYEIDRRLRPLLPMVEPRAPDDLLMSVDEWVGVVDRAIQLVGEDHVALGSDFDGGPTPPRDMRDVRDVAMITDAMLRRGYSPERIRKFLGGNLMRVFRQVTSNPDR
jgi:membrane dipeptidase